jgi:diguanylate cyclase (GGDEF)-like protein
MLDRLIPVESLDAEGLLIFRDLSTADDEDVVREGIVHLLDRLCDLGRVQRLSRADGDGVTRLKYRDLVTLDTIGLTIPLVEEEPQAPAARAPGGRGPAAAEPAPGEGTGRAAALPAAPEVPGRDGRSVALTEAVLEAIAASSRRIDLAGALDHLYDLLRENVEFDRIAVFKSRGLSNSQAGTLSELDEVYRWADDERLSPNQLKTLVEEEGRTIHIPDIASDERFGRYFAKNLGGSLLVAPLEAEAYIYGVLEIWSERPSAFDDEDIGIVEFVAEFAGGLIKRRLEVEELIFIDHTSQIHNRRYFEEQLTREIERCKRTGNSLALLVADLDDFKQVNDTLGHAAGDSVLRQVAQILSDNARQVDIVARYGGEEFVVILPDITSESAVAVAERIRSAVETHRFITGMPDDPTRGLTISIGCALYPLDAKSRADLIDKADRVALYEAKRAGKNRTVLWTDTQSQ